MFRPEPAEELRQHYRLIDAPLTRYLIGFGLSITGLDPLPADWNWSFSWEENLSAGAVPNPRTLFVSRFSVASLTLLSLVMAYLTSSQLHGRIAGFIALLLFGLNALIMLHTRRAMAEASLVFSMYLILCLLPKAGRYPLWIGIAAGLALCAKQSTLPTAGVAALGVFFLTRQGNQSLWKSRFINMSIFIAASVGIFVLLNPVFWNDPLTAFSTSLHIRQELLAKQIADWGNYGLFSHPAKSILVFTGNLFFTQPAIAESTNYLAATQDSAVAYLSIGFHNVLRGLIGGSLFLSLLILGIYGGSRRMLDRPLEHNRVSNLYLLGTALQSLFILVLMPLPWQRYVVPVLPYVIIWISLAVSIFINAWFKKFSPRLNRQGENRSYPENQAN
jgi:hypothetical protein